MKSLNLILRQMILVMGSLFISSFVRAQEENNFADQASFNHLNVQPAESWMFMKYGPSKPNLFTGTVRADIPLYTYKDIDFEIPLSLSYSSNGLIPDVQAGSSGLGWYLNGGGSITREINGFPDELGGDWQSSHINGYLNYVKEMPVVTSPLMQNITFIKEYPVICTMSDPRRPGAKFYETTPDLFQFNFMGHSGSFMITHTDSGPGIVVFDSSHPSAEYRVELFTAEGIRITTGDGYVYTFTKEQSFVTGNVSNRIPPQLPNASTHRWTLSKIKAPNGRTAIFEYANIGQCENRRPAELIGKFYGLSTSARVYHTFHAGEVNTVDVTTPDAYNPYVYTAITDVFALSRIIIGNLEIKLKYGSREPEKGYSSGGANAISSKIDELRTPQKLDAIYVSDIKAPNKPILLKECVMQYKYGAESGNPITLLHKVTISGEGTYEMQYYDEDKPFPPHLSLAVDHWGYYNGISHSKMKIFIPGPTIVNEKEVLRRVERNPNDKYALQGMLKQLKYPTGGSSAFHYEKHTFSKTKNCLHVGDFSKYEIAQERNHWHTGGLRIKSIIDSIPDPQIPEEGYLNNIKVARTKRYEYKTATGQNSGILTFFPRYMHIRPLPYHHAELENVAKQGMHMINLVENATDELYGYAQNRTHIEYSDVKEYYADKSYTLYHFTNSDEIDDDPTPSEDFFLTPVFSEEFYGEFLDHHRGALPCSMQAQRGKLAETTHYDKNGQPVAKEIVYREDTNDPDAYIIEAKVGAFAYYAHKIYVGNYLSTGSKNISYFGNRQIESSTRYSRNELKQIRETAITDSKGDLIIIQNTYAHEMAPGVLRDSIKRKNLLTLPLKTVKTVTKNSTQEQRVTDAASYSYACNYGLINLMSHAKARINSTSTPGNLQFDTQERYIYDSFGRIIQVTDKNNLSVSYLWGFGGLHPVAKIENSTIESVNALVPPRQRTEGLSDSEKNTLNTRFYTTATTYEYKPFVGITEIMSPIAQKVTYHYNKHHKLQKIVDMDGNTIQSFIYSTDNK